MYEPLLKAISEHNLDPANCPKEVSAAIATATGYNEMLDAIAAARDFIKAAMQADNILGKVGRATINVNALNYHMAAVTKTASTLNYRAKALCDALGIQEEL